MKETGVCPKCGGSKVLKVDPMRCNAFPIGFTSLAKLERWFCGSCGFTEEWIQAITNVLKTFKEQQRKEGVGPYKFQRKTERALDTLNNDGLGAPVNPVGLIVSAFRPSDDATTLQFLVPSNFLSLIHI